MKKTFYHATLKENALNIIGEGIKAGVDGYVYLSDTIEGSLEFMKIRPWLKGHMVAVIPVYLDEEEVELGTDHNTKFIKAHSYIFEGDIPVNSVETSLLNIPLFSFGDN